MKLPNRSCRNLTDKESLRMRFQIIEALLKTGVIVVGNSGMEMPTSSSCSAPR